MEILHQSLIHCTVVRVITLKDELFVLCYGGDDVVTSNGSSIRVCDCNNLEAVRDVIVVPDLGTQQHMRNIAACNVTDYVYVLVDDSDTISSSIVRIQRDEQRRHHFQTWITDISYSAGDMSVSIKGRLLIIHFPPAVHTKAISIFNLDGSLQRHVVLSPEIYGINCIEGVIQKSNGNLLLTSVSRYPKQTVVLEIDENGIIEGQYTSEFRGSSGVSFDDISGRILINNHESRMVLLDSEFNTLDFTHPQPDQNDLLIFRGLHYDRERNEFVGFDVAERKSVLTIFRFNEE